MKKVLKIVSLILAITCLLAVAVVPASAASTTTNGKWDQPYSLIYNNGKCASADTYYIYNALGKKTVYIKSHCVYSKLLKNDKDVINFYKNIQFTVKIYKLKNNKYVQVDSPKKVDINGNFTIPSTLTKTKYKVVISKSYKGNSIYGIIVKGKSYDLNYCISTKK